MPPKKVASLPFVTYSPNPDDVLTDLAERWAEKEYLQVASMDPSYTRNFGLRVERRYRDGRIEMVVFERNKVGDSKRNSDRQLVHRLYPDVSDMLDRHREALAGCHMFVLERQMCSPRSGVVNYECLRVLQHTVTYLLHLTRGSPHRPLIFEVEPYLKSRQLEATKGVDVKVWTVDKAKEILERGGDEASLKVLMEYESRKTKIERKLDDLCDTVCQVEALFKYLETSQGWKF